MILPRTVKASISSQGIVQPESELILLSELSSRVEWLSPKMEAGSSFKQGDTLIVLDKRDYELALISAESEVLNAEVNLEREQAESDLALDGPAQHTLATRWHSRPARSTAEVCGFGFDAGMVYLAGSRLKGGL